MSVKDMLAEFKMEDKRNEEQSNSASASGRAAGSAGADGRFDPVLAAGAEAGGLLRPGSGTGGGDAPAPQKSKKGKKGKKDRRR